MSGQNLSNGLGRQHANSQQEYFAAKAGQSAAIMKGNSAVRDLSPVDMALDQLQKMIEVGHEEMRELRDRLSCVTDQGAAQAGSALGTAPQPSPPSQIEGRLAHMIDRALLLQCSLRELRNELRI